jgi:hypothetical protein
VANRGPRLKIKQTNTENLLMNKSQSFTILSLVLLMGFSSEKAWSVPIVITTSVDNSNTDNILFNDGSLMHSGALVEGNFSAPGNIVNFTSSSGNGQIQGGGGQATISGLSGNDPFTNLMFELSGGATFTAAVFNPDATSNGIINFVISYLDVAGSPSMQAFALSGSGQNFFRIDANDGAKITKVEFYTTDTSFVDASQFRIGGISVPEPGSTLAMLGLVTAGLMGVRRRRA